MKKIMILVAALVAIMVSGCSTKTPGPMVVKKENNSVITSVVVVGSYDFDMDKVSPAQNVAIAMKKAVLELKKQNVKYFTMDDYMQVPPMITNFEDMINYCFPENEGFNANAWTAGSTSLENKCRIKTSEKLNNNDVVIKLHSAEKNLGTGTWVVDEVLKDKNLDKFIKEALKATGQDIYFSNVETMFSLKLLRKGSRAKKIEKNKYKEDL